MNYTSYYCKECGETKYVQYETKEDPVVKCNGCGSLMHRALPNWLNRIKNYKET